MLEIVAVHPSDLPVIVTVDPYIPIVARTFSSPIGAVYYRVGNFATSLVEVPIDPVDGTVRGIKLVTLDRTGSVIDEVGLRCHPGLPVVAPECLPASRLDESREVSVSLLGNRCLIDWSNGDKVDSKATHGRMTFFLGGAALLGAAIEQLTESETRQIAIHLQASRKP